MYKTSTPVISSLALVIFLGAGQGTAAPPAVDFNREIRPILAGKCFNCHGADEGSRKAKLRLDLREEAIKEREGMFSLKPAQPEESEVIRRILSTDPEEVMPPPKTGHAVTATEAALLKQWIAEGASYAEHWAFQKPVRPRWPQVSDLSWARNGIDFFVLQKLEQSGLKPSPTASRHALIRRLSLDLTGLPPTPEEVAEFLGDSSAKSFERLVDRLLASPAFGERWARPWLDLARYADSAGYGSDPLRLNMYPWRDWVIAALNRNMRFDEFTRQQLAGDLMPEPTEEQLVATAFHRNTMTNTEGGTDDEEWRVAAVKDRVNVTLQGWMGLTVGCAQCHTHKFDPISHREYYQLFALFNQTEDNDQPDDRPTMPVPTRLQRTKMITLSNELASVSAQLAMPSSALKAEFADWEKGRQDAEAWTALHPLETESRRGATLTRQDDESILATDASPAKDVYTITTRSSSSNVTAVRLEIFPDASLSRGGPGRSTNGSFVLTQLRLNIRPENPHTKRARFLRLELPGSERMLSLAEVEIYSQGTNVARRGKARQSSTTFAGAAKLAIDGNTDGEFEKASTTHTQSEESPWWELDLGAEVVLDSIKIWNRTDHDLASRLDGLKVRALDESRMPSWEGLLSKAPAVSTNITLDGSRMVSLRNASADTSSEKFPVGKAIPDKPDPNTGWSTGKGDGKVHLAIFELDSPLEPGLLTFTLEQNAGQQQTIGRFRLATTSLPAPVRVAPAEIQTALDVAPAGRTSAQQSKLLEWFGRYASSTSPLRARNAELRGKMAAVNPNPLPVMREVSSEKRRKSFIMNKGNFLDPGEPVQPALLSTFHSAKDLPPDRAGLAEWLVDRDNPLTGRVLVNRFWAQLFGMGLVETEEDFGTQGQAPSHPELLDWLALELVDSGWDVKRLLKTIVLSATYQQEAKVNPASLSKDPRNSLLASFPRRRLDAEMIRDQALALSGLLSKRIGGASVYPPQPDGLWRAAFNGQRTYPTSTGEDRYRRGLYTVWRRTTPYPGMATFDAPSRETCTFRRLPTNTPLQAYVTLNDPVFVEASQALGRRLLGRTSGSIEDRVRWGLQLVLVRPPETAEVEALVQLYRDVVAEYRQREDDARRLATEPLGALPPGMPAIEAAAWTAVGNVLLNLDGVLTKG